MPDPSLRPWMVSKVARNQVEVDVVDALSSRRTHVDADVVSVGVVLILKDLLFQLEQVETGSGFIGTEFEKTRAVSKRNDERVARADRVTVPRGVGELIPIGHAPRSAEQTRTIRIPHSRT